MGILVENLAASHLVTLARHAGVRLFHWRRTPSEVDLLYDEPENPLAFEIASSDGHGVRGFRQLVEDHPKFRGNCYLVYPDAPSRLASRAEPGSLSLDLFLLLIGKQMTRSMEARFSQPGSAQLPSEARQLRLFDELQ